MHETFVRARGTSRHLDAKAKAEVRTILGSRAHTARGLLMSASQSGNFSTSHRVMHEPRGGEQAILPDQSKWARHGNCRTLGGASIRKPFPNNARLKNLDRDPRPLSIENVPEGYGIRRVARERNAKFWRKSSSISFNARQGIVINVWRQNIPSIFILNFTMFI